MFNLEPSIAEWRRRMIAGGIKTPVPLEELESHLRDHVERQRQLGMGAEQAFCKAVEDIGSGEKLEREFAKVRELNRIRTREVLRRWSAIGGVGLVYSMLATVWTIGMRQRTLEITWIEIVLALGAMIPMIGFGWVGNRLVNYLPVSHRGVSLAVAYGVIFLGAAMLRLFWNAITPANLVQTQILTLWTLSPLPGVGNCLSAWIDKSKLRDLETSP
jgi:hypothetical protein